MFLFWKWHKMETVSIHLMEINYLRSSYWQSQWNCNIGEISISVQKLIEYPVKPLDLDPDNIKIHRLDKEWSEETEELDVIPAKVFFCP